MLTAAPPVAGALLALSLPILPSSSSAAPWAEGTSSRAPSDTLTLAPGDSHQLSEDLLIRFGRSGTEFSVPDIIFGERYALNDPENINYLPIQGTVRVHDDGTAFTLAGLGCTSEEVVTDVVERRVTGCRVEVRTEPLERAPPAGTIVQETVPGWDDARPAYRADYITTIRGAAVRDNPLLYIGIPEFFLQDWRDFPAGIIIGGAPDVGGSRDYELRFPVVTNFGVAEIVFLPRELFDEVEKEIRIGPVTVSILPEKHVVADRNTHRHFSFHLTLDLSEDVGSHPVRILDFAY